jgi:flagellar basal-body rod protein FlgB
MSFFGDQTMSRLTRGLDAASLRQRVLAHNLANLNTPGFKRSTVSFAETLQQAGNQGRLPMARTHERHLQPGSAADEPRVVTEKQTARRIDGNNVDLEREMLELVDNQLRYNAYIQQVNSRLDSWRFVINEGRR